jgi:hypothetical protein
MAKTMPILQAADRVSPCIDMVDKNQLRPVFNQPFVQIKI